MRKISLWFLGLVFAAALTGNAARAQEDATQQQIDKLSGQIQDILDAQTQQGKRIDALEKQIGDLSDKMNQPGGNNFASAGDLKDLAEKVQQIEKKRQEDNQKILDTLDKLGKTTGAPRRSTPVAPVDNSATATATTAANVPTTGHYYTIQDKDTISGIAKKYRAEGVKVSVDQILAANPGLNPSSLIVGKKIFIPDANAK